MFVLLDEQNCIKWVYSVFSRRSLFFSTQFQLKISTFELRDCFIFHRTLPVDIHCTPDYLCLRIIRPPPKLKFSRVFLFLFRGEKEKTAFKVTDRDGIRFNNFLKNVILGLIIRENATLARRQTNITDFFQKNNWQ